MPTPLSSEDMLTVQVLEKELQSPIITEVYKQCITDRIAYIKRLPPKTE